MREDLTIKIFLKRMSARRRPSGKLQIQGLIVCVARGSQCLRVIT
jgi:hypothetical protein